MFARLRRTPSSVPRLRRRLPLAVAVGIVGFVVAGSAMFPSAAGSAALGQQLGDICASESALRIVTGRDDPAADLADDIGASLPYVEPLRRQWSATVQVPADGGSTRLTLLSIPGQESNVEPHLNSLSVGEVALSDLAARRLGLAAGDSLEVDEGVRLRVAAIFRDVPAFPLPDFWCGWASFMAPKPSGDPPLLSALVSEGTVLSFPQALRFDEYRVQRGTTISQANQTLADFEAAKDTWVASGSSAFGPLDSRLGEVIARAAAVRSTIARSLTPVLVTGLLAASVVLVSVSLLISTAWRRDLRLAAVRGTPPARVARDTVAEVALVVAIATLGGAIASYAAIAGFAPSSLIEAPAWQRAGAGTCLAIIACLAIVGATIAAAGDRSIDRPRRHSARGWLIAVALLLLALTAASFRRLDREGGIRISGVNSVGGALLPMAFPLLALLTAAALTAATLVALAPILQFSGPWMGRATRLGWRRAVMSGASLAATVVAAALATGCLVSAEGLASAASRALRDKADVYVGADLSIDVFGDPSAVVNRWSDASTTVVRSRDASVSGQPADLIGIDRASFAGATILRRDASSLPLSQLVAQLAPPSDGPAPALLVGGGAGLDERLVVDLGADIPPLVVEVVSTPAFFPGKRTGRAQLVIDDSVLLGLVNEPRRTLLVTDPPDDAVEQLRAGDVRVGVVRSAAKAFDGSAYSAVRWAQAPLAALGAVFAILALAVQAMVLQMRARERRTAHVFMRRTGFSLAHVRRASFVEAAIPFLLGTTIGAISASVTNRVSAPRLDPMPTLLPPATAGVSWSLIACLVVGVVATAGALAVRASRDTARADPFEAVRGDL